MPGGSSLGPAAFSWLKLPQWRSHISIIPPLPPPGASSFLGVLPEPDWCCLRWGSPLPKPLWVQKARARTDWGHFCARKGQMSLSQPCRVPCPCPGEQSHCRSTGMLPVCSPGIKECLHRDRSLPHLHRPPTPMGMGIPHVGITLSKTTSQVSKPGTTFHRNFPAPHTLPSLPWVPQPLIHPGGPPRGWRTGIPAEGCQSIPPPHWDGLELWDRALGITSAVSSLSRSPSQTDQILLAQPEV